MVLQNPNLKLNPKIKITWSWNPSCCFVCIDLYYALDICIYLQCRTLLSKTRRAPINMPHAIVTYIISLTSMPNYKIHGSWTSWVDLGQQLHMDERCWHGLAYVSRHSPKVFFFSKGVISTYLGSVLCR
jgi:hypothetical protein